MQTEEILRLSIKGIEFCENGGTLDEYLDRQLTESEPRRTISSILFNYFRNKGIIDSYLERFAKRKTKPVIRRTLSVVSTQILFQTAVPVAILADVAVSFIKKKEDQGASGFVNAMIRQLIKYHDMASEKDKFVTDKNRVPTVLLDRWKKNFSQDKVSNIIEAIKTEPPFTFRTVFRSVNAEKELNAKKIEGLSFLKSFDFFSTEDPAMILSSDIMKEGKIYIQDPATVLFGEFIMGMEAKTILDYCSAPGGKTILIAEIFEISKIIATDRSLNRLERVKENIERFGLKNVEVLSIQIVESMPDNSLDMVLLDVPCSNTGVIRHRPDVMFNFSAKSLKDVVKLQSEILEDVFLKVKKGGRLIYSTCSIEPEENQEQINNFTARHPEFIIEKEQLLMPTILNDGAFIAVLRNTN